MPRKGHKMSEEQKQKIRLSRIGFKHTLETKLKLSGKNNPKWKGDKVGYFSLHVWVRNKLGKPKFCEECKTTKAKRFEWSNISHKYKRELTDWKRLCQSCHIKYDDLYRLKTQGFKRKSNQSKKN